MASHSTAREMAANWVLSPSRHEENNGYSPERAELIRLFPSGRSLPQEPVNGLSGDLMPSAGQVAVIEK